MYEQLPTPWVTLYDLEGCKIVGPVQVEPFVKNERWHLTIEHYHTGKRANIASGRVELPWGAQEVRLDSICHFMTGDMVRINIELFQGLVVEGLTPDKIVDRYIQTPEMNAFEFEGLLDEIYQYLDHPSS